MILDSGEMMTTEYINARTKVKIQCINGHEYEITPNNYKKGRRCKECFKNRQKKMMDDRWNGVVSSVVEQCDSNVTTPTPKKTPKPVVSSVVEQCDSNVTTPTPKKTPTLKEQNTSLFREFVKTIGGYPPEGIKKNTNFTLIKSPESNGTKVFDFVHKASKKRITLWIFEDMPNEFPKGDIFPIILDRGDVSVEIGSLEEWMNECIVSALPINELTGE